MGLRDRGKVSLPIDGETRAYGPKDCYVVRARTPGAGPVHAKATRAVDVFSDPDRHKPKRTFFCGPPRA